jgi:hypothetical protein
MSSDAYGREVNEIVADVGQRVGFEERVPRRDALRASSKALFRAARTNPRLTLSYVGYRTDSPS